MVRILIFSIFRLGILRRYMLIVFSSPISIKSLYIGYPLANQNEEVPSTWNKGSSMKMNAALRKRLRQSSLIITTVLVWKLVKYFLDDFKIFSIWFEIISIFHAFKSPPYIMEVELNQNNNEDDLGAEKKSARKVRLLQATALTCYTFSI